MAGKGTARTSLEFSGRWSYRARSLAAYHRLLETGTPPRRFAISISKK